MQGQLTKAMKHATMLSYAMSLFSSNFPPEIIICPLHGLRIMRLYEPMINIERVITNVMS